MGIKHIEAGRKGGRPRWFKRLPLGTPGIVKIGGPPTEYGFGMSYSLSDKSITRSLKDTARESLLHIMPD